MEKSSMLLNSILLSFAIIAFFGVAHASSPPISCNSANYYSCNGNVIYKYDACWKNKQYFADCSTSFACDPITKNCAPNTCGSFDSDTKAYCTINATYLRSFVSDISSKCINHSQIQKVNSLSQSEEIENCGAPAICKEYKYAENSDIMNAECFDNSCTQKVSQDCLFNNVYSIDSCGNRGELVQRCEVNEKCEQYIDTSNDNRLKASCLKQNNCYSKFYIQCISNTAYYYDSCGNQERVVRACSDSEICDAKYAKPCRPKCQPRVSQKCIGNEIYYYDSCGNKGELASVCGKGYVCGEKHCVKDCQKNYYKACVGKSAYYYDSCDNKGDLIATCKKNEICSNGKCEKSQETCASKESYSCYNGNVYWYDSCGNREVKKEDCGGRGCSGKECKPDTSGNFSVSVGSYSDAVEKGYYGSLVWSTSGNVKETGVEISYNSNKSDAKKAVSKLNSANSYAALISTESCLSPYIYVRAYAVGSATSQAKYTDWQKITVQQEYCSRNSRVSLMSAPTCSVDSPNCDNGTSLEFSIEEVDLAALGWEGIKLFTIGSCIDEGVLTLGCGFDAGTTVLMIVPESTLAAGASKVANLLSKGSKIVKEARTIAKLSKITKKISLVIEAQKKTMTGVELARAAELGLVKIDFFTGKIYSDFTKLALHYAEKGEVAITRLQKAGATNEMLEAVLRNGGSIEKTINVTKSSKGTIWLEEGTTSSGWKHIYEKHIKDIQKGGTKFKDIGINDESQVQKKIFDTVKNPSNTLENSTKTRRCLFSRTGAVGLSYVKVVVGGNGYIITSYPVNNLTCSD